jgi:hypothetical protein
MVLSAVMLIGNISVGFAQTIAQKPGTFKLEFEEAKLVESYGTSGYFESEVDGSELYIDCGTFNFPGSYLKLKVTIKNTGDLKADLVDYSEESGSVDFSQMFDVDFEDLDLEGITEDSFIADFMKVEFSSDYAETIEPGQSADFDVTVRWDVDGDYGNDVFAITAFAISLDYENDETVVIEDEPGEVKGDTDVVPKTGDEGNPYLWIYHTLTIVSGLVLLASIVVLIASKKKSKQTISIS